MDGASPAVAGVIGASIPSIKSLSPIALWFEYGKTASKENKAANIKLPNQPKRYLTPFPPDRMSSFGDWVILNREAMPWR